MVTTRRGTRQGCCFGGLMFSLLYSRALQDARQAAKKRASTSPSRPRATCPYSTMMGHSPIAPLTSST